MRAFLVLAALVIRVACDTGTWTAIADALEAGNGGVAQNATHNGYGSAGKLLGHIPRLSFDDRAAVTAHVAHSMSATHYIDTMYVRDQAGRVVGLQRFSTTSLAPPSWRLPVPHDAVELTAYAHCNTHGLWRSAPYVVAWERDLITFLPLRP